MSRTLKFKSILIACDHAAFHVKQDLLAYIQNTYAENSSFPLLQIKDLGVYSEDRVDYPDVAKHFCETLLNGDENQNQSPYDGGILLCGSGIGVSITANRFNGIRAALCHDHYTAKMSREHNNSNVLCAGARVVGFEVLKDMVDVWLATDFLGGRHAERVHKIDQ